MGVVKLDLDQGVFDILVTIWIVVMTLSYVKHGHGN